MDMKQYEESEYLSADLVENSPTKVINFLNSGEEKTTDFGKKPQFLVEIDHKKKFYRPNKTSVAHLNKAFGSDSNLWIGKQATVRVETINAKRSIIASPVVAVVPEETAKP